MCIVFVSIFFGVQEELAWASVNEAEEGVAETNENIQLKKAAISRSVA